MRGYKKREVGLEILKGKSAVDKHFEMLGTRTQNELFNPDLIVPSPQNLRKAVSELRLQNKLSNDKKESVSNKYITKNYVLELCVFNPLMLSGSFNICCPRDCVSRHNGGTSVPPLNPSESIVL